MTRIAGVSGWRELHASTVAAAATRVYPAQDASGHWYLSTTAAEQDATLALKASRIFLDTDVTDGGILALLGAAQRVAMIVLPASTI